MVSFRSEASLLTFCLEDRSIGVRGVLKSPSIIVVYVFFDVTKSLFYEGSCTYVWGINVDYHYFLLLDCSFYQ